MYSQPGSRNRGMLLNFQQLRAQTPDATSRYQDHWQKHQGPEKNPEQQADGEKQTRGQWWQLPEDQVQGNQVGIVLRKSGADQNEH